MVLKQIGVRLEEELITKTKKFGLDNKLSLQQVISEALTSYLDNKLSSEKKDNMITSEHDNKITKPTYSSGIDWDNIPMEPLPWEQEEYVEETRYDEDGNPYTIKVPKPDEVPITFGWKTPEEQEAEWEEMQREFGIKNDEEV